MNIRATLLRQIGLGGKMRCAWPRRNDPTMKPVRCTAFSRGRTPYPAAPAPHLQTFNVTACNYSEPGDPNLIDRIGKVLQLPKRHNMTRAMRSGAILCCSLCCSLLMLATRIDSPLAEDASIRPAT